MIESYLAAGALPFNPEGADDAEPEVQIPAHRGQRSCDCGQFVKIV